VSASSKALLGALASLKKRGVGKHNGDCNSVNLLHGSAGPAVLLIEGRDTDRGEHSARVQVTVDPPAAFKLGMNIHYLIDHVEACGVTEAVLCFGKNEQRRHARPLMSKTGDGGVFATMPERL
jgi:hypothetical protein